MVISKYKKQFGFAILYAVLMVSIVLTISLTLLDISYKQLVLSSINQESKKAYYAAASALNCAIYWERDAGTTSYGDYKAFGTFTGTIFNPPTPSTGKQISCAKTIIDPNNLSGNSNIFTFSVPFSDFSKAVVTVFKGAGGTDPGTTLIEVDGYNTSDSSNPRRVQRSLDATL